MDEIIEEPGLMPVPAPEEGGILLTGMAVYDLNRAAKWAKFLAIFGFVISGLLVIMALSIGSLMSSLPGGTRLPAAMGFFITTLYLAIAALSFVLNLYLYQFADRTAMALTVRDAELLERGIHRLQSYFKAIGIVLIVELSLMVLGLVIVVIAGAIFHH